MINRIQIISLLFVSAVMFSMPAQSIDYLSKISDPNLNAKSYLKLGERIELNANDIYDSVIDIKNAYDDIVSKEFLDSDAINLAQFVFVSHSRQLMLFFDYGVARLYLISTAANGLGEASGSLQTPRGVHLVKDKIGEGLPINAILKGRVFTGVVWGEDNRKDYENDDLVLSRVLWLEGLEERNKYSHKRYIYFHGTNHPEDLGSPASHGCIRMGEQEVIEFFDSIQEGLIVKILEV